MTVGIGMSFHALKFISVASIFVNCGMLLMTEWDSDVIETPLEGTGMEILLPDATEIHRFHVLAIIHYVMLGIAFLLSLMVRSVGSDIRLEEFRQRYFDEREDTEYRRSAEASTHARHIDSNSQMLSSTNGFEFQGDTTEAIS